LYYLRRGTDFDFNIPGRCVLAVDKNVRNPDFVRDNWILFIESCRGLESVDKPDV
jgi:hypothetical protein